LDARKRCVTIRGVSDEGTPVMFDFTTQTVSAVDPELWS
jgi:hypothetical protein